MYEERVVCFIDILGWKARTESAVDNTMAFEVLRAAIREIRQHWLGPKQEFFLANTSREVSTFSDSVVASALLTEEDSIENLLTDLMHIQMGITNRGIWLRGGVTVGLMHHTSEEVFGPALNRAYSIENSQAVYPRIVIDDSVFSAYPKEAWIDRNESLVTNIRKRVCLKDCDGRIFIDYFTRALNELDDPPNDYLEYIQLLKSNTEDLETVARQRNDDSLKAKAYWCRQQIERLDKYVNG